MILNLQLVNHLLDIRNRGSNRLDFGARRLRSDLTVERDYVPPIRRQHRLVSGTTGIDDRQAPMAQAGLPSGFIDW